MGVRQSVDTIADVDAVLPFKINASSNSKCYFCGRNRKEIAAILQRMSKKIADGIRKLETQIDNLTKQYLDQEKKIRTDLKNVDLSLKIVTVLTDRIRFKKDIPHLDLLLDGVYAMDGPVKNHLDKQDSGKKKPVNISMGSPSRNRNKLSQGSLKDLLDGLRDYFAYIKYTEYEKLNTELVRAKDVHEKYADALGGESHELGISALVKMVSKPLTLLTGQASGSIVVRPRRDARRDDKVQFNLTACHFCFDRFQGSTL